MEQVSVQIETQSDYQLLLIYLDSDLSVCHEAHIYI